MNSRFPKIIDGGLSNVLESYGHDLSHPLWTARLLVDQPEAITKAHLDYLNAGAECITTSSYQASLPGFQKMGFDRADSIALLEQTTQLAKAAVSQFLTANKDSSTPFVASSIGPYGAYLADGSEYTGNYAVSHETLTDFHQERLDILQSTGPDFIACETIPSFVEAKVLSMLLEKSKTPAWISFSCKDELHINDGTPISDAAQLFKHHGSVFAIGINCTRPEYVSGLINELKKSSQKKIIVYPNSGESYHPDDKNWTGKNEIDQLRMYAEEWRQLGADIIGGCCRIGPEHITALCHSDKSI